MDLSVYINELLGLQGEVTVPGIGHFTQVRVNGFYDEAENKFYPPTHKVNFEYVASDDERLAKYIANKKNISLASSKYFIEKYVNGLRQQLATKKVEITGLGYIYAHGSTLGFNADNLSTVSGDPSFFGFKPVDIASHEEKPAVDYSPPPAVLQEEKITERPRAVEETSTALVNNKIPPPPPKPTVIEKEEVQEEQEYEYEEPTRRSSSNIWIIVLLIVIIILLALLGLYKYKPDLIDRFREKTQTFVAVTDTNKKADTDTSAVKQDSVVKPNPQVSAADGQKNSLVDSTQSRFELMAGSFKTQKAADLAIENFKTLGIEAKIVSDAPGKHIQVSIGTFKTRAEADQARLEFINSKKVSKDIYPLEINPKK